MKIKLAWEFPKAGFMSDFVFTPKNRKEVEEVLSEFKFFLEAGLRWEEYATKLQTKKSE